MRRRTNGFTVLALAAVLLGFCLPPMPAAAAPVYVVMDDAAWSGIDHAHCRFADKQQLLEEVSYYADAIAAMTGREDWTDFYGTGGVTVAVAFTNQASHVEGAYDAYKVKIPKIYINRTMAEYDFWPLAHELTHLICPEYSSLSLREGLACYMQDEIGQNPAVFNYGLDVHAYAFLLLMEDEQGVLDTIGSPDNVKSAAVASGAQRAAFYLYSYSFSRYLIETYGIERFMELYTCGNIPKACRLNYGCGMDTLLDDWRQFLYLYPAQMTQAEIDQRFADTLALHGMAVTP